MHGVIFAALQRYVQARVADDAWPKLLEHAGLGTRLYMTVREYPDEEASRLVVSASALTGRPPAAILEDFGEFLVPDLIALYKALIEPAWRTLDLLERTEETIHRVVRLRDPAARPPALVTRRLSPSEVEIVYRSPRRMCALAKGIVKGVAKHYKQVAVISEASCMLMGAPECKLRVRVV